GPTPCWKTSHPVEARWERRTASNRLDDLRRGTPARYRRVGADGLVDLRPGEPASTGRAGPDDGCAEREAQDHGCPLRTRASPRAGAYGREEARPHPHHSASSTFTRSSTTTPGLHTRKCCPTRRPIGARYARSAPPTASGRSSSNRTAYDRT